ncbi:MAG: hypothetical protein GEU81_14290, partial [Nitriliruptorales bacterium]|nr:hypothetical protein [Nitriliruptorales bacterium]
MHPGRRLSRSTVAVAVGLLVFVLAGCGADSEDAPPAATPEEPANGEAGDSDAETDAAAEFDVSTVEFVVPFEPGGGYDQYVRVIAPFLADCLGGADVVAINEPGAGGLLATNQTGIAPPDGSRIQIFNTIGAIGAQMAEAEGANFDLAEFTWLARITDEPSAISVATDSEFEDFQDLIDADRPVRFVATGPGSNEYIFATVLGEVYGFDVEMITGFAGSGEAQASVIQGNADAQVLSIGSSLGPIQAGDMRPIALVGSETHQQLPDTPTVFDYSPEEGQEEIL